MGIRLDSEGGNYPYHLAPYRPANIRAEMEIDDDGKVRIHVHDLSNIDRWEILVGDFRHILSELLKHNAAQETRVEE